MRLAPELVARAVAVAGDADPLDQAGGLEAGAVRILLSEPDERGDRWLAEVGADARGVVTARLLPLPAQEHPFVAARLRALLAGESDALHPRHVRLAGDGALRWPHECGGRVLTCAWTPEWSARAFEQSRATGVRRRQGAFYTPALEVDLVGRLAVGELLCARLGFGLSGAARRDLLAWILRGDGVLPAATARAVVAQLTPLRLLDPACGAGGFLVGGVLVILELVRRARALIGEAHDGGATLARLIGSCRGIDVDAAALAVARTRLRQLGGQPGMLGGEPELLHRDALLAEPEPFDLVLGNPPYVRHEEIRPAGGLSTGGAEPPSAADYKRELMAAAAARGHDLPGRADLYLHFCHHALDSVAPGGACGLVVSASWLDLDLGRDWRDRLCRRDSLLQVHESRAARSFTDADISSVILIAGRGCPSGARARFVRWSCAIEEGAPPAELAGALSAEATTFLASPSAGATTTAALAGLDPELGWGGRYLRAPEVFARLAASSNLVSLGSCAEVRFGIKTGANGFFYVTQSQAAELGLPATVLRPLLGSARECPGYRTSSAAVKHQVLWLAGLEQVAESPAVAAYLAAGAAQGIAATPSVAARRPWWRLPPRRPAAALVLRRIGERFAVFDNDAGLLEDNNLFGIEPHLGVDAELLLASLNSTWTRLALELSSRPLTGAQAVIDTNVYIVRALRIPDLAAAPPSCRDRARGAWQAMRQRSALPLAMELDQADRHDLDLAVLAALGVAADDRAATVAQLHAASLELVSARLVKAGRSPELTGASVLTAEGD